MPNSLSETTAATTPKADLVADSVQRHFGVLDGELLVGGLPVSELARQYGTPLFVYDRGVLRRQFQSLRSALPRRFDICYSVKANPNQALLRFFVSQGCGLEIASSGELLQALSAGCAAERILFAGPGKTTAELAAAIDAGIGEIHVESLLEARRIAELASHRGRVVQIALRVNPAASIEGGGMRMGGKPAPFGIDEDQLDLVMDEALRLPSLDLVGLHLFMGTQILDCEILALHYRAGLDIARRISARLQRPLKTIDFGGGLGVPYFANERRLDLTHLRDCLFSLDGEIEDDPALRTTSFVVEPGRFLVAESGIYVAQVNDIKLSRGKKYLITDGGMHHHLAASGNLGQTIKRNFPVAVLNRLDAVAEETVDVVGPLCTPLDVLARGISLPTTKVGDLIGVFQSGAYARAASPLGFLSRQAPPEVWVEDGTAQLIRRRGTDEDYLSDQICGAEHHVVG